MLFFPVSHLPWISSFQEIPPFSINTTILCFLSLVPFLNVFSFLSSLCNWHTTYLILARTREWNYILTALLYITTCITLYLLPSYKTTLVELTQKRSFTKTTRVGFIYLTGSVLCIMYVKETMKLKNLKDIRKGNKCPIPFREG